MNIKLLKEWQNGNETWSAGQLLSVPDYGQACLLIQKGIAKEYIDPAAQTAAGGPYFFSDEAYTRAGMVSPRFNNMEPNEVSAQKMWEADIEGSPSVSTCGFKSFVDFLEATRSGVDLRLKALSEGMAHEGGWLVPQEWSRQIIHHLLANSDLIRRCTTLPMTSSTLNVPGIKDVDRSSTGLHGLSMDKGVAEEATISDVDLEFESIQLNLHSIKGKSRVSNEMMEDSVAALSILIPNKFAENIADEINKQFIRGTGAAEMLGFLNAPGLVSVTGVGGASSFGATDLFNMWARLEPSAKTNGNVVWITNPDCIPTLYSITIDSNGTPVQLINASTVSGLPLTLFGRPIVFSEHASSIGNAGDISLVNCKAYYIGKKSGSGIRLEDSRHVRFEQDQHVFRAVARIAGQPAFRSARTPAQGSNTLSHFVTIGSSRS